jgi:UDP-N-acetylglucosamine 2-epimerase
VKILSVVGARPQFIKAAPVSRALRKRCDEVLVHTGQHYDLNMSQVFFEELEIPEPDYNLGVGSGTHAWQTGQMLIRLEELLLKEQPDWVLVYGDTNSTLAGALAAAKLHIPVAHIEAGLRSFNKAMPEEINRVLADHLSTILFCPTGAAAANLLHEGFSNIPNNGKLIDCNVNLHDLEAKIDRPLVINTGDVMYDALLYNIGIAENNSIIIRSLGVQPKQYYLATVHRAENTDDPARLQNILQALALAEEKVVLPMHPRTGKYIADYKLDGLLENSQICVVDPVSYLDMLVLEKQAKAIVTDSGGVQKEAYLLGVPCITLRNETEWVETVAAGANKLVGCDAAAIEHAMASLPDRGSWKNAFYGDGHASELIVNVLQCVDDHRQNCNLLFPV